MSTWEIYRYLKRKYPEYPGIDYLKAVKWEDIKYTKCRLCMDYYPVYSVDLTIKPPVRAFHCQPYCCFCTLVCLMSALEIVDFVKVQAPLYHHTTEVYAFPILDRAEAEGKFRRIIPEDKVGWDTYSYQIYKNIRSGTSGKGWYRSE